MAVSVNSVDVQVGSKVRPFVITYIVIKRFQKAANVTMMDLQNLQLYKLEKLIFFGFKRALEIKQIEADFKLEDMELWLKKAHTF